MAGLLLESVLGLKAYGKRQIIRTDRRDQDEVHAKTAKFGNCSRCKHQPRSMIRPDSISPAVIARDDPTHRADTEPSPVRELRRIQGTGVKRGSVQGVAKMAACRCPLPGDRAFDADARVEVVKMPIRTNMI